MVGDVHGCLEELLELMDALGYRVKLRAGSFAVTPPAGRKLAFLGDLVSRGPSTPGVLRLVMGMVRAGQALSVPGNQDVKLSKALKGHAMEETAGLARALQQLAGERPNFRTEIEEFLDSLPGHCSLDDGRLVIAHAGLPERLHGSKSAKARTFALSGQTTGERDEFDLLVRYNWAADYRGKALVVYGHTPVVVPLWLNNTVNIDTGCVYGGCLTALRYPERESVSVPAKLVYSASRRGFGPAPKS